MNTAQPNRPFYLWLDDVCDIIENNTDYNNGRVDRIPFWWDLYRRNYSPFLAVYFYSTQVHLWPYDSPSFTQNPFPAENTP